MSAKLFEAKNHAKIYGNARPTYPVSLYQTILSKYEKYPSKLSLALDIACGSGQSTVPLKAYFDNVIGLDVSAAQIEEGRKKHPDINFRCGPAEDLSFLRDDSVDLITCASALHWLDIEKFIPEAKRVLKEDGMFVFWCYSRGQLDKDEANIIYTKFFFQTLGPYWHETLKESLKEIKVDDHRGHGFWKIYEENFLQFKRNERYTNFQIERDINLSTFMEFVRSVSACESYMNQNPESKEELEKLHDRILAIYNKGRTGSDYDVNPEMKITWPLIVNCCCGKK